MNKKTKIGLYIVAILSLIVCCFTGYFRIKVENDYKNTQIAVRYSDVLTIAYQTGQETADILKTLKEAGATTIFLRENTVLPASKGEFYNYKEQGFANVYEGYDLQLYFREAKNIDPNANYIVGENPETLNKIYKNLYMKGLPVDLVEVEDRQFIEVRGTTSWLTILGVGFPTEDLETMEALGYTIAPQIKCWNNATDESIDYLIEQMKELPNLGTIYFSDADLTKIDNPALRAFLKEHQVGFIEFTSNKQKGFEKIAKGLSDGGQNYNVVRLHTLTPAERAKYTPEAAIERYRLAVDERNIRSFLVKMPTSQNAEYDAKLLVQEVEGLKEMLQERGYVLTTENQNYNLKVGNYVATFAAGIATFIVLILLCDLVGFTKLGYVSGGLGLVVYAILLKVNLELALKMIALGGSVLFPSYAVLSVLKEEPRDTLQTIGAFVRTCLISFGGALTIIGTLSRTSYGLGIDVFSGVKIASILPIIVVLAISFYQRNTIDLQQVNRVLHLKVSYLAILGIALIGGVIYIYTARTGNIGEISAIEVKFRQMLYNVLGVRPRTKEFLIGYPMLLILLYYGYKQRYFPLLILAVIGQNSLVNTYAHVHTPVVISLIRTFYGVVLGIVIGVILIEVIKIVGKVIKKWTLRKA